MVLSAMVIIFLPFSTLTDFIALFKNTSIPLCFICSNTAAEISSYSLGTSLTFLCIIFTSVPKAENVLANSVPIGPPPITPNDLYGSFGYFSPKKVSLVTYPASSSPSTSGILVLPPTFKIILSAEINCFVPSLSSTSIVLLSMKEATPR